MQESMTLNIMLAKFECLIHAYYGVYSGLQRLLHLMVAFMMVSLQYQI